MGHLTAAKVKSAGPGKYHDGQGLHLRVTNTESKSWFLRLTVDGRRRDMGLGGYPEVSLVDARRRALEHRTAAADGRDPVADNRRGEAPVFRDVAQEVLEANRPRWRGERQASLWWRSMENHAFPVTATRGTISPVSGSVRSSMSWRPSSASAASRAA